MSRETRDFSIGPFHDSATAWLEAGEARRPPVEPVAAATVMLMRGAPLEVFMIERAPSMEFAPSTWVFPGGRVDPADGAGTDNGQRVGPTLRLPAGGLTAWACRAGVDEGAGRALLVTALRELFEEAGVLLASREGDDTIEPTSEALLAQRARLEAHEVGLAEITDGLVLRGDLIEAVDRWITPEFERRRFDTWFFEALLPDGATADAVTREARNGRWVRPAAMLAEADAGALHLLPPTRTSLQRLAGFDSADDALAAARTCSFEPTRPRVVRGPEGLHLQAEVNL